MEKRVNVKVRGFVQGVGFRMFVVREATERNLKGWTRNLPDGAVEIEAQGSPGLVDELIGRVNIGPSRSRVTSMAVREIAMNEGDCGFHIIC
jgi:acylphosphatase